MIAYLHTSTFGPALRKCRPSVVPRRFAYLTPILYIDIWVHVCGVRRYCPRKRSEAVSVEGTFVVPLENKRQERAVEGKLRNGFNHIWFDRVAGGDARLPGAGGGGA